MCKGFYGIVKRTKITHSYNSFDVKFEIMPGFFATFEGAVINADELQAMYKDVISNTIEIQHHVVFGLT